jgi:hypothetical protein
MGRSRCRRGRQYGDEWQRQQASIQWGDNQFRFLEVPEKNAYFYFFSKNLPLPEICRPWRLPSPPNGKTASGHVTDIKQQNT